MEPPEKTHPPPRFAEVVAEWQHRLLQLDRRNNLLYFRPGKSAVQIAEHTPDSLMEALSTPHGLTFDYAEPRSRRRADRFAEVGTEEDQEPAPYMVPGDLRGDCPTLELQRRLGNLRRREREWQEEQGLNVLFLALGFLEWIDEDGELARSPLLLLPAELERASPRDVFTLRLEDDAPTTNTTLAAKLREFGVELPEADSGTETASPYLDAVRQLVAQRPDWKVHDDIYLATFSYSKLAMYHDLDLIINDGTDHPVVLTLSGAEPPVQPDSAPSPLYADIPGDLAGGRLDDVLEVRDQFAVLPADYSQLRAVTAARSGHNLVVHGPPGTGKSQTIANIIATFLAEGKSVLFVSEKTAALDVVKRRLDEKQLGVFCLDLHSERGKKDSVYQQLQQSVDDLRAVQQLRFDYEALAARRQQLNRVVRALHKTREPLSRTVFFIQGLFASIRDVPDVPFEVKGVETLDQPRLAEIREAANRVRLRPREFKEHWSSHWRVLRTGTPSLELASKIRRDMETFAAAVEAVRSAALGLVEGLGLPPLGTVRQVSWLGALARHMARAPGVPQRWLQDGVAAGLRKVAEREKKLQSARARLVERLSSTFGSPLQEWDFAGLAERLAVSPEERRTLRTLLGDEWSQQIVRPGDTTTGSFQQASAGLAQMGSIGEEMTTFLQAKPPETWTDLHALLRMASAIGRIGPVPPGWVEPRGTEAVVARVERARAVAQDLHGREERLFSEFEPAILDVVDRDMLVRYRTDHQGRPWRFLASSYRSDRKAIQAFRRGRGRMPFRRELQVVEEAQELTQARQSWREGEAELASALGDRCSGRDTQWDVVLGEIRDVGILLERASSGDRTRLAQLLTHCDSARRAGELADSLERVSGEVEAMTQTHMAASLRHQVGSGALSLASLGRLVGDATVTMARLEQALRAPLASPRQDIRDIEALRELMRDGARLHAMEQEHDHAREALRADFGSRFKGFDTDWADVLAGLGWAEGLSDVTPPGWLTPGLLSHAEHPQTPAIYKGIDVSAAKALQAFRAQTAPLLEGYDLEAGPWDSWEYARFEHINQWSNQLMDDADSASDWLGYRAAVADLDHRIGATTVEQIRRETENSELLPRIVERRVLGAWLDWMYQQEPLLAHFTASEQQDLVARFKELDQQLAIAAQHEVRKRVYERYPSNDSTQVRAGELSTLRGELAKRRRRLSVRKLIQRIPILIKILKPCFLVSPLAVSQHLPFSSVASETLMFDVVVFDEASQVFPEDAVPAILRGRQAILAGDRKQLPPTNFWRRSEADDNDSDDNDDDDDAPSGELTGKESILDAAVGLVGRLFREEHLNVHYRSRDESLIRFSNHCFYDDRLLTFPSPGIRDPWFGLHDVYVPDGRYDAGATRTNRREAERVVDLVYEHMRNRPLEESLGVVALSRPQADLIERLVDERRILERDVDERFKGRPDEPFFVKNLENVQGDERDHMILSIGYGPTVASGAVPNRFGPLIASGGERRLNVVVTRARRRVDVVHSLRASDIRSEQTGAKLLRRYLEYAANPIQAFEGQVVQDPAAEPESPFESSVGRALISRGHRIQPQVGVSGYRIDLAILSEDGARYDLGIECDGATYHRAPAARDRDWLRQQVLEGLGWTIHRVWSTAWVRNPRAELERIEAALARARAPGPIIPEGTPGSPTTMEPSSDPEDPDLPHDPPMVEIVPTATVEIHLQEYQQAMLPSAPAWKELRYETPQTLVDLITRVAEVEGPVHKDVVIERIRQCYELGRVRGSTRDNVEQAIKKAQSSGAVLGDGTFVWLHEDQTQRPPRAPVDGHIEHLPPTELKAVVLAVARAAFGIPRPALVAEAARTLGFHRTGDRIAGVLDALIQELLDQDRLGESFGSLHEVVPEPERQRPTAMPEPSVTAEAATDVPAIGAPQTEGTLADRLRARGLAVVDMRASNGNLWVVDGPGVGPVLREFEGKGVRFSYARGRVIGNRPGWWTQAKG